MTKSVNYGQKVTFFTKNYHFLQKISLPPLIYKTPKPQKTPLSTVVDHTIVSSNGVDYGSDPLYASNFHVSVLKSENEYRIRVFQPILRRGIPYF